MTPTHVLVPLDGSPLATEALDHALETYDCRVTVLNVLTPLDSSMSESGVLDVDEDREETARRRVERLVEGATERAEMEGATERAESMGRTVETEVESGDPADTILASVDSHDVDMVVMGGHGADANTMITRLLGTVATKVVESAPVSVTVIR